MDGSGQRLGGSDRDRPDRHGRGLEQFPNECFRWFNSEPYARARKVANEAQHHAPGSSAQGLDPFEAPAPLTLLQGLQFNTPTGPTYDKNSPQWAGVKQRLEGMSTEQRAQFYTQDPGGKELFNAYMGIVSSLQQTWAATLHHAEKDRGERPAGFAAEVVGKQSRKAPPPVTAPTTDQTTPPPATTVTTDQKTPLAKSLWHGLREKVTKDPTPPDDKPSAPPTTKVTKDKTPPIDEPSALPTTKVSTVPPTLPPLEFEDDPFVIPSSSS